MSITSNRFVSVSYSGDLTTSITQSALDNITAFGQIDLTSLISGDNTITAPIVTGLTITGLTIIPPAGNTTKMIIKGVGGDTGIAIHDTDPTSIGLDEDFTSLVINAAAAIVGVRFIWS